MYKNNKKPKDILKNKKIKLSIHSSLGVSIDCGHVPIFLNLNLQYLHRLQLIFM